MQTKITREKLVKCATCPFYNKCPDSVRLSPLCARQKKLPETYYYMGDEAFSRLERAHKN